MHDLVRALEWLNLVLFVAVAVVTTGLWRRRRGAASLWAMLAFCDLAVISLIGRVAPQHPHGFGEGAFQRVEIALLLLFPYLLFRFTTAFDPPRRTAVLLLNAMTVAMIVWTFAQPTYPTAGEPRPLSFQAYLAGFLLHWTVLSAFSAWRLWRVGTGQPTVARRRMRLLALATGAITVALFLTAASADPYSPLEAAAQALAAVSIVAFLLGFAPPAILRLAWRAPEQRRVQEAIESLMTLATSREEVVERVLGPMADVVGARAIALHDSNGAPLGSHRVAGDELPVEGPEVVRLPVPDGTLTVWTSRYAPFFGDEELRLLETLSALTGLALDRVRLYVQEHESRVRLERANEVMATFVSLAAHELRTPVTSIHGFVHTLNHLGDRLTPERRDEISRTLEQQTARMARLVEQLLDLSRLDAEAIDIVPQPVHVRQRLEEVVDAVLPPGADGVSIDAPEDLVAEVDPAAFERIVGNLVANALRYGSSPVVVRAEGTDRHFRVTVEDCGRGVPPEFVPDLFERFTRSEHSRSSAGTGLGLAIARSYARAHGGDLLYEPAEPKGARFQLVLPKGRPA